VCISLSKNVSGVSFESDNIEKLSHPGLFHGVRGWLNSSLSNCQTFAISKGAERAAVSSSAKITLQKVLGFISLRAPNGTKTLSKLDFF
jgi:hypothetical protein